MSIHEITRGHRSSYDLPSRPYHQPMRVRQSHKYKSHTNKWFYPVKKTKAPKKRKYRLV